MKILKDTFRPEMARIKREIAALRGLTVHVGIMGDAGGDLLMIAGVHEYGATIHAKNVKHLAIPLTAEAKDAGSPRSFSDLEFIPISPGYGYLVREKPEAKGKAYDPDNYDWLYMLVESVEIPERSFIRAAIRLKSSAKRPLTESFAKAGQRRRQPTTLESGPSK